MPNYSQINGKIGSGTETMRVTSCVCKEETATEKFRFTVAGEELQSPGMTVSHTIQAMSEYERKHWVEAMGGTWPSVNTLQRIRADSVEENLNSLAFTFLKDCLNELEDRGLNDQGLYRVGGVVSKVKKLLNQGLDPQPGQEGSLDLSDPKVWESKTIASAVKQYFRDLNKPLMTHTLYNKFIEAVKLESEDDRLRELQSLVQRLPIASREILKVLVRHLSRVASRSERNLMTASNLGVCFGPTLLRPKEETVASIMDIKFSNQVVEILIENCDTFFANRKDTGTADSSPDVGGRNSGVNDVTDSAGDMTVQSTPTSAGVGRGRIKKPREKRGSSTPKRTQSFSSFSQLSTSSLPDIKEFKDRALAALSAATSRSNSNNNSSNSSSTNNSTPNSESVKVSTASTTEILNNRFRSKSTTLNPLSSPAAKQIIQSVMPAPSKPVITTTNRALGHFMPPSNSSSPHHPHLVVSGNNKTNSEQLIESLEMMKNLAADLPTNNSPLRRSYTVHARKLTRQAPVSASSPSARASNKPPLPKNNGSSPTEERPPHPFESAPVSTPVDRSPYSDTQVSASFGGRSGSSGSSSACSSNNGSLTQHHYRPPPPIPTNFVRINSVPALPTSAASAAGTPPPLPFRAEVGLADTDQDTPPPIPVRRYRRIYVNNVPGGQLAPISVGGGGDCYSSESSDLAGNIALSGPPVPAPRPVPQYELGSHHSNQHHNPEPHVTSPSPLTADSGIAMSPPMRKVSEIRKALMQSHSQGRLGGHHSMAGHGIHGGGVHGGHVNKKKVSEDSVSVGSSTNHSDDSKYDNLSASSSTSINSSGRQQQHKRLNTSQSLVHAAAEIAAAKHQAINKSSSVSSVSSSPAISQPPPRSPPNPPEDDDYHSDDEEEEGGSGEEDEGTDNHRTKKKAVVRRHSSRIRRVSSSSSGSSTSQSSSSCSDEEEEIDDGASSTCFCCGNDPQDPQEGKPGHQTHCHDEIEVNDHCVNVEAAAPTPAPEPVAPPVVVEKGTTITPPTDRPSQADLNRKSAYENFIPPPVLDDCDEEICIKANNQVQPLPPQEMSTFQRLLAAGQTSNV